MTTTDTTTAARYTVERFDNGWHVVTADGEENVTSLTPVASRQAGRELVKRLREGTTTEPESTTTEPVPDPLTGATLPTETPSPEQAAAEQAALDVQVGEPPADPVAELQAKVEAPRVKAEKHQRITLARVAVGDELMTNLHTDGEGRTWVEPHRFSDGQVRKVAEVTTRKAEGAEMPGTLYTLVFEDGTCSEERYGTTSHYRADAFTGQPAPAPAEKPAPAKKAAKKAPAAQAPKIATTPSRAGKLTKGSRLVLRDLGVVTVDQVSKTGEGKLEVAYTQADGEAGVREMWASTNVRIAAE